MAPALKSFLYIGLHRSLEARRRYVLDCVAVILHNMKANPLLTMFPVAQRVTTKTAAQVGNPPKA